MATTILRIDSSARVTDSVTRELTDRVVSKLAPEATITRDLAAGLPFLSEDWLAANWTAAQDRTKEQHEHLALSEALIDELRAADVIVIGTPMYNFGIPAALKAWIDLVARAGLTFKYTDTGPKGLLEGKRAIIVAASGGTKIGSEIDFATQYLKFALGFIGIKDVDIIAADQMALDKRASLAAANDAVDTLAA